MLTAVLLLGLLSQGIPVAPSQGGSVSGVLLDSAGKPLPKVRIAAVALPESPGEAATNSALSAIVETDEGGRYRLENVPPGRYYISAGKVTLPTYYPGTQEMKGGTALTITAGSSLTGIDFRMKDTSVRGPNDDQFGLFGIRTSTTPGLQVPLSIQVEGWGNLPVFSSAGFPEIVFTPASGGTPTIATFYSSGLMLRGPTVDFHVSVEKLPPGYAVKSLTYDKANLPSGLLHLPASTFAAVSNVVISTFSSFAAGFAMGLPASQAAQQPVPLATLLNTLTPTQSPAIPLEITLTRTLPASTTGVRVTGKAKGPEARSIFLSGVPGILFSDGTFEFRGVQPGRHTIVTLHNPSSAIPLAASIEVGNRDIEGIQLEQTPVLPLGITDLKDSGPAGNFPPGATIPLVSLHGTVVDNDSGKPVTNGRVFLSGGAYGTSKSLDDDGKFEVLRLLPGNYTLEIQAFGYETVKRTIAVGDDGAMLEIPVAAN